MTFRATLTALKQVATHVSHAPNAPLELDPALSRLLHDTDLSLLRKFRHGAKHHVERAELEVEKEADAFNNPPPEFEGYEVVERGYGGPAVEDSIEDWDGPREERRSPAAVYGTKHIGMVVLPWELEHAVERVVGESDKYQLRSDAKRLFFYPTPSNSQPASSSSGPSKPYKQQPEELRSSGRSSEWQLATSAASLSFSTKGNYKTVVQLAPREGLAFATVAMPAHYAATANVFREIANRMAGPGKREDRIETVIDFGGKSGQGLWASLVAFREPISPPAEPPVEDSTSASDGNTNPQSWTPISASPHQPRVGPFSTPPSHHPTPASVPENLESSSPPETAAGEASWTASTVKKYILLDSRRGMTELARRFVKGTDIGGCEILYQDYWGKNTRLTVPERSLALCAFTLSELPTGSSRKRMVSEMWESGAEWMVIVDHGTQDGFDSVAQARELLLELGRKEVTAHTDGSKAEGGTRDAGSHVVAPCPHSHACPLHSSPNTRDICHFTQRMQTPPFLRLTKHSREGHEDVAYSYVVVRRGQGPTTHFSQRYGSPNVRGLVGAIGREEAEKTLRDEEQGKRKKAKGKGKEKAPKMEKGRTVLEVGEDGVWRGLGERAKPHGAEALAESNMNQLRDESTSDGASEEISEETALRSAITTWPRIVYPPLKRSGHVILDTCTNEGSIARMTIPRSQGKQAYHDARKASWGDAFPHAPRIAPQLRTRGIRRLGPVSVPTTAQDGATDVVGSNRHGADRMANEIISTGNEGDGGQEWTGELGEVEDEEPVRRKAKGKDRLKRKGLREARLEKSQTPVEESIEMEDWINSEASELALLLQAKMVKDEAERQGKVE
ncbi:hypothetical protein BDV93DRAFT_492700 [Ceratobasidium sp. AG-I]|nr:hypothetical protein BDV93DRAFT_492700 [Ceratobasidium sp. AG-I]